MFLHIQQTLLLLLHDGPLGNLPHNPTNICDGGRREEGEGGRRRKEEDGRREKGGGGKEGEGRREKGEERRGEKEEGGMSPQLLARKRKAQ